MIALRTFNFHLSSVQFLIGASVVMSLLFNAPFLMHVYQSASPDTLREWLFYFSVPVLLSSINIIFLSLVGALFAPRVVVAVSVLIASFLLYANVSFGIIFDSTMIQNMAETNSGEALSYLNVSVILFLLVAGALPLIFIAKLTLRDSLLKRVKSVLLLNAVAALSIVLIGAVFYKDYSSVGRNNKGLVKYIIPYAFYDSAAKYVRNTYLYPEMPYRVLDESPVLAGDATVEPHTTVVVVGETARADKFASNGYYRQTTRNIESLGAVSFSHVESCGTATAVSVPCMFSRLSREEYESRVADKQDNALDIIQRAGVNVTWIDNNSSCKGVCKRVDTIEFDPKRDPSLCDGEFCFDQVLLNELRSELQKKPDQNRVIVLHMIGSHGPTYYLRYPPEFAKFLPDCPRSDIQHCSEEQLINTYDNTIVYTDYIIGQVIEMLSDVPDSSMLYVSDHGESLGENGLFLHGFPYSLAPKAQTHVPLVFWNSHFDNTQFKSCVEQRSQQPFSHDNVYDTLLGLTHTTSRSYQSDMDIFQACRT